MPQAPRRLPILAVVLALASSAKAQEIPPAATGAMDFARDVAPIFAQNCQSCHGAKAQKGGLRLDVKSEALAGGDGGEVIEPGKGAESRLVRYVAGAEPDHVMPPRRKEKGKEPGRLLTPDEIGRIRAWIDQGAPWPEIASVSAVASDHWAFRKPLRPDVPAISDKAWARNPIDAFVRARLEREGLKPSPEADRTTLIRRLSLDLTGLPPSIAEVDAFLADARPEAYEKLVDRLMASPRFGERWARRWLDKARYADTNGYEKDRERSIWPYRDWVVNAYNADMPFDRFTIEQLAGDLLPNPTPEQKIATGFHRNTMRNEEGGIDVEEYRYISVVDRTATTGSAWLGLTIGCAQCHTHKYDPITQREYYQFFAFLNNTDEPEEYAIPDPEIASKRSEILAEADRLEKTLADAFPAEDPDAGWKPLVAVAAVSSSGAKLECDASGMITVSGPDPEKDDYTIQVEGDFRDVDGLRLEAIGDPKAKNFGPGRTPHGNFVVTAIRAKAERATAGDPTAKPIDLKITSPSADFTQPNFNVAGVLDDDPATGWAIDGSGRLDRTRALSMQVGGWPDSPSRLMVKIEQQYGGHHTLGRFRLLAHTKQPVISPETLPEKRRERIAVRQADWEKSFKPASWKVVAPTRVVSRKNATMTVLPDGSVLATGDKPNNDVYELELPAGLPRITAIRLEALPHESLPENGPGRAPLYTLGGFILTEINLNVISAADPKASRAVKFAGASQSFAEGDHTAAKAIDGVPESGWTVSSGQGKPFSAVFELSEPLESGEKPDRLAVVLHQFGIHQTTLGRFRVSVTGDPLPVEATGLPAEVEAIALVPAADRTEGQKARLTGHFLSVSPETATARAKIDSLRKSLPRFHTSLVMEERSPEHARTTNVHRRGEFFSLGDPVEPGVPAVLPPLPSDGPRNRLALARWIASPENPLTARVAVNDLWLAVFGRGIVATQEDFGTRGERPSHPELLDWLATEFMAKGWSQKTILREIVTSSTYRQASKTSPEALARDPKNILLGRGARFRVDAETVRDIALTASGLINLKVGGPSVYPPQPEGVTSLSYGQTAWPTSQGADRYRRGLYTYVKRTAPFAAFSLMDAPSPETACVRRERSNTPLQALTLLNDPVYVEAARSLALRVMKQAPGSTDDRVRFLVRTCLTRPPSPEEAILLAKFYEVQLARFRAGELDSAAWVGLEDPGSDRNELAAWAAAARAVLNLDETITKE